MMIYSGSAWARVLTILFSMLAALVPTTAFAQRADSFDHESVIQMTKAGLSDSVIIARIRTSNIVLDTSADSLVYMHKAGVSADVLSALVDQSAGKKTKPRTVLKEGQSLIVIPEATELKILVAETIRGKKVKAGQPLNFTVADDLKIDEKIVVAKGSLVSGVVTETKKPGMLGRSGKLSIRIESTEAIDGQKIKLRSVKGGSAGDNFGTMYTLAVLFGPVGLLTQGKDARIKANTILTAYIDEPVSVLITN